MRALLVILAMLTGACGATLHRMAQASEIMAQGSLACDAGSTHVALRSGNYYEENPMIEGQPSDKALGVYFGSVSGGVFLVNRIVARVTENHETAGSVIRIVMNGTVLAIQQDAIRNNLDQGVSLCGL